ncbi:MAG: hypothetical protein KUG77_07590 [Nannocystaceae bacterium]|nr:hypothetical protein [Nannocystaceae bacterium]
MTANVFEESKMTLTAWIARGAGDRAKAKFEFEQEGGAETVEAAELELGGKEAGKKKVSTTITLPKCKDDEDFYTLSYKVSCEGSEYPGGDFKVWLKTATFKAVDGEGAELKGVPITFNQTGDKIYVTDSKGEVPLPINGTGKASVTVRSPCSVDEWTTEVGRLREATVTKKEYKAIIATPDASATAEDKPHKQFVNLKNDDGKTPNQSSKIKLYVGGMTEEQCISGIPGDTVHIKVKFHDDNSKRNSPKPALIAGGATVEPDGDGEAKGTVTFDDSGAAEFEVELGKAGGDKAQVMLGITDATEDSTLFVENWRRVWYQLTMPAGTAEPDLTRMVDALADVYVEYLKEGATVEIAEDEDAPTGISWFDGAWLGKGTKLLNIGDYNSAHYHAKFVDTHTPWQVHVLCCHCQFDTGANETYGALECTKDDKVAWSDGNQVVGVTHNVGDELFAKKLNDDTSAFVKAKWKAVGSAEKGALASGDVWIDSGSFTAKLPQAALDYLGADAAKKVKVTVTLFEMAGPYLGESDDYKQLIVIDQTSIGVNDTLTHELGHSLNQVPTTAGEKAAGLKAINHAKSYTGNGHSGGHCADGMTDDNYGGGAGKAGSTYQGNFESKSECTCVMYGEDNTACTGKFCDTCKPFVLADAITSLH